LLDRYCALVQTYSEAVLELRSADSAEFEQSRAYAEQVRVIAQQARLEWEEHERTHACVRKPAGRLMDERSGEGSKTA